jgi:RIO-like serine/threonine protein kinase
MDRLSVQQFNELIQDTVFLKGNYAKPKVLLKTSTQEVIKVIKKSKKWFSISHIWSYAKRFELASIHLKKLSIPALYCKQIFYYPAAKSHIVIYGYIAGTDLCTLTNAKSPVCYTKVLQLMLELHEAGVYFRDFHLGNVLLQENQQLALIDVSSVSVKKISLNPRKRARNFLHWFNRQEDKPYFEFFSPELLIQEYLKLCQFTLKRRNKFLTYMNYCPRVHLKEFPIP